MNDGNLKAVLTDSQASEAVWAFAMQYGGLGLVFALGIVLALRAGELSLQPGRKRRWLLTLLGGYGAYALVHGVFQFYWIWE